MMFDFRNLYLDGRALSLLILRSGDVEMNPGPFKARSEVLRMFMRFVQTDLVHLIYKKKEVAIPTPLYDQEPPGWSTIDPDIKFDNICNIQSGGSKIFEKLIKLCRKIGVIPKDYIDVILSYEQLRDTKRKTDEAEKSKTTLENFMSRRKSLKNKEAVLEHLDEDYVTIILQKATELLKQGAIGSAEGICKMFDAAKDFVIALEEGGGKLVEPSAGVKRPVARDPETETVKDEVKRQKIACKKKRVSNRKAKVKSKIKDEGEMQKIPCKHKQGSYGKTKAKSKGKQVETNRGRNSSSFMAIGYKGKDAASLNFMSDVGQAISQSPGNYFPIVEKRIEPYLFNEQARPGSLSVDEFPPTPVVEPITDYESDKSDAYIPQPPPLTDIHDVFSNQDCLTVTKRPERPPTADLIHSLSDQSENIFRDDENLKSMDIETMAEKYGLGST